jgi:hypothetical protein
MRSRRLRFPSDVAVWISRFALLCCLLTIAILFAPTSNANLTLKVNETAIRIFLERDLSTSQITELALNGRGNFSYLSRRVNVIIKSGTHPETFTPRRREYFPETLLWQPELTTDSHGRARLEFKLADNITTWKVSVIGSNESGEVGTAETEIRAFQPFLAEIDPPRVLTEGDRISLPVVLRNHLDHKQAVNLELKPERWFTLLEGNKKHTFKFRPRFGMTAKATVSSVYDYYNPEAIAVVAPGTFVVR